MLDTSDLILTLGIKFWASLVEERDIRELEEGHLIISQIKRFLKKNNPKYSGSFKTDDIRYFQEDLSDDGNAEYTEEDKSKVDDLLDDFSFDPVCTSDDEVIKEEETDCDDLIRVKPLPENEVVDPGLSLSSVSTQAAEESRQALDDLVEKEETPSSELGEFRCEEDSQDRVVRVHQTEQTSQRKSFKCEDCDKEFSFKSRLREHQATHTAIPLQCKLCDKEYKTRKAFNLHEKSHTNPGSPVVCPICGISFKNNHGLEIHKFRHVGPRETPETEANIKCRFCGLRLTSQGKKSRHEFEVHDHNSRVCTFCGKKFNGSGPYEKHLSTHSKLRIPCGTCGKVFSHQRMLIRHKLNVHQADCDKRYQCSFTGCTRGFNNLESLESHMNCHLGIKPYKCDLCEARFQNKSNQLAHLRKVHHKRSS